MTSLCLWIVSTVASGQPVDIMVKNTFSHEILQDGTPSGNKFVCNQKTFINNSRLILERLYNVKIPMQDGYVWYFYDSAGRLKSVENYDIDGKPKMLRQILYNESGDTLKIIEYTGSADTVLKTAAKTFYYNSSKLLTQTRTLTPDNKLIERARNSFNQHSRLPAKTSVVNNSTAPYKGNMKTWFNDTTGLPRYAEKQVRQTGTNTSYRIIITYNVKGNPVEEKYLASGKLFKIKKYEYAADIELVKSLEEDDNGRITALYTIETYWHKANLNPKSYFE
jgi:hypothetical protein